jgi:hypothetical protein
MKSILAKLKLFLTASVKNLNHSKELHRLVQIQLYYEDLAREANRNPDSLVLSGFKVFSQVDEDGIIERIFTEIGTTSRVFVEIGCGNGLENNTHYLLLKGWRGVWVDGSRANIDYISSHLPLNKAVNSERLVVINQMVTQENALDVVAPAKHFAEATGQPIDFLSVDIDSFETAVVKSLSALAPRVICIEYNPELRPPLSMGVESGYFTGWKYSFYHGASLQAVVDDMEVLGYVLVSCSLSGFNAFFVKRSELKGVLKSPLPIERLYQSPKSYLIGLSLGHRKDFGFLSQLLNSEK